MFLLFRSQDKHVKYLEWVPRTILVNLLHETNKGAPIICSWFSANAVFNYICSVIYTSPYWDSLEHCRDLVDQFK